MKLLRDTLMSVKSDQRIIRVIKTGVSSVVIRIFSIFISFMSVPLTYNYLGNERYGIWLTITSFVSVLNFADFGLGVSLINSISKAYARDSVFEAKKEISNIFFILTIICVFSLFIYLQFSDNLILFDFSNFSSKNIVLETQRTLSVFIVITLLSLPLGIVQRIFEGYQEGFTYQKFLLIGTFASFIILFIFIKLQFSLPYLATALLLPNFAASILAGLYLFFFKSKHLLPSFKLFNIKSALINLKTGFIFFLLQIFSFINLSSDNFIISKFDLITNVPHFDLTKKLFSITLLLTYFITPLWPAFAEALEKKDFIWAKKYLYKTLKILLVVTSLISFVFMLFNKAIFKIWIGRDIDIPFHLLVSFFIFSLVANFGGVMSSFFSSNIFLKKQLVYIFLATFSTFILKIIFIKTLGSNYLIWANNISFFILFIIPSLSLTRNYFKKMIVANI